LQNNCRLLFRTKHIGGHKAPENSLMGLGELLLLVAALWGAPLGLWWISWHRYGAVPAARGTNRLLARASLALLSLSSGIWLLLYGLVLISEYYKAVNSILNLVNPATLAVVNILVCAASFMLSLFMPKTVQGTIPLQRAITFATGYMVVVWMFALTAH
jgi:hypothetical protein